MNVHEEISAKVKQQRRLISQYEALDKQREDAITLAVSLYKQQQGFEATLDQINRITKEMNALVKQAAFLPQRKQVTTAMLIEYANKK